MQAFPSGHAGAGILLGLYPLLYLAWTLSARRLAPAGNPVLRPTGCCAVMFEDLKFGLLMLWYLAFTAYVRSHQHLRLAHLHSSRLVL